MNQRNNRERIIDLDGIFSKTNFKDLHDDLILSSVSNNDCCECTCIPLIIQLYEKDKKHIFKTKYVLKKQELKRKQNFLRKNDSNANDSNIEMLGINEKEKSNQISLLNSKLVCPTHNNFVKTKNCFKNVNSSVFLTSVENKERKSVQKYKTFVDSPKPLYDGLILNSSSNKPNKSDFYLNKMQNSELILTSSSLVKKASANEPKISKTTNNDLISFIAKLRKEPLRNLLDHGGGSSSTKSKHKQQNNLIKQT
jgi:hypothetical protein